MKHAILPVHPHLLHPRTGARLRAIGLRRDGSPIWPIMGGDGTEDDANDKTDKNDKAGESTDDKPDTKAEDKPLGENGEKALKAERDARKALETQLSDLKKGLATALGVGDDTSQDDDDKLAAIQQKIADMEHRNAVLVLANDFRITDKDDLALLSTIKDETSMKKLAERLAPAEEERDATSRRPKPDRSQGGGGSDSGQTGAKSVKQVMAERAAARAAKNAQAS